MILLSFMYIDIVIFRYRFRVIINSLLLSRRCDNYYIIYIFPSYVTSRIIFRIIIFITFSSFIIITLINLKNLLTIIIFS